MKRLICITGIILIGCVVTTELLSPSGSAATVTAESRVTETVFEDAQVYILKIDNGYLNVYKKGESSPFLETGTMSGNLPQSDVSVLRKGVEIIGDDALRKALEDYCS